MTRKGWGRLLPAIALVAVAALSAGQTPYERNLEIRTSTIPHAGDGVFAKVAIPKGAYLGAYTGEFVTEEEFLRRSAANKWQYMMGLLDCARPNTDGLITIDGISGNVFTRMNYAPPEFQNVKFEKICDPPFVKVVALRDIAAGEELWVDYGPRYLYDFMEDPAVIAFFADLRARRAKKRPTPRSRFFSTCGRPPPGDVQVAVVTASAVLSTLGRLLARRAKARQTGSEYFC